MRPPNKVSVKACHAAGGRRDTSIGPYHAPNVGGHAQQIGPRERIHAPTLLQVVSVCEARGCLRGAHEMCLAAQAQGLHDQPLKLAGDPQRTYLVNDPAQNRVICV